MRAVVPIASLAAVSLAWLAAGPASAADPGAPPAGTTAAERPSCLGKARLRGELFTEGSASPIPEALPMVDLVADAMKRACAGKAILIEGHTEASGDPEGDLRISEARAAEVRRLLIERGVPEGQLQTKGFGSSRPLVTEPEREGMNRRVTFVVEGE